MSDSSSPSAPATAATPALCTPATTVTEFTPVPRAKERSNGWKPEVQRAFVEALAETGSVSAACKRVGRSDHGAYQLRRHPEAASFRAAWDAALDFGVRRIEDAAMDRALNGTEETIHYHGEQVAVRRRYNERLVMFILRSRAPERFGDGTPPGHKGAIGKMELRRRKKKWKKKLRAKWEAKLPGRRLKEAVEARRMIEEKLEDLRQRVRHRQGREWREMTPETREAWRHYQMLRARDLRCEVEDDPHLPGEEELAAEQAEWEALYGFKGDPEAADDAAALPPPEGDEEADEAEEAPPEPGAPKVRTLKDEGWD